jgi:CYTH domain-containing protein
LVRTEIEVSFAPMNFEGWYAICPNRVVKTRYRLESWNGNSSSSIAWHSVAWDIDVFDDLPGLVIAEIEYLTENPEMNLEIPEWLGLEVTDDERYYSHNLARYGAPQ